MIQAKMRGLWVLEQKNRLGKKDDGANGYWSSYTECWEVTRGSYYFCRIIIIGRVEGVLFNIQV